MFPVSSRCPSTCCKHSRGDTSRAKTAPTTASITRQSGPSGATTCTYKLGFSALIAAYSSLRSFLSYLQGLTDMHACSGVQHRCQNMHAPECPRCLQWMLIGELCAHCCGALVHLLCKRCLVRLGLLRSWRRCASGSRCSLRFSGCHCGAETQRMGSGARRETIHTILNMSSYWF